MSSAVIPQRFVPFRKPDLVRMCLAEGRLPTSEHETFLTLCNLLEALLHYEYYRNLERLKDAYAPFDPDADTRLIRSFSETEKEAHGKALLNEMTLLLNAANFEPIALDEVKQSMAVESLFNIRLEVDFNDFEDVLFFKRGRKIKHETMKTLFGLRKRTIQFVNYDRVAVYIRFKEKAYFETRKRKPLLFEPGIILLKLFHNVPEADLEMLFPNSRVRMKLIDKLILGIPATVSGLVVVVSKLGASLLLLISLFAFWSGLRDQPVSIRQEHLITLGTGLGALGIYFFKQISKFKNRKIRFMKALTENLYFRNLDNNAGVFHRLIDSAEEEEFKEALLAYYFLLTAEKGLTISELDHAVEAWLAGEHGCRVDFEIDDALRKLNRLGIVRIHRDRYRALPLAAAVQHLDNIWDGLFDYQENVPLTEDNSLIHQPA